MLVDFLRRGGHVFWMVPIISWLDWVGQLEHHPGEWVYGSAETPPVQNLSDLLLDDDGDLDLAALQAPRLEWVHAHNARRVHQGLPLVGEADFDEERACFRALASRSRRLDHDGTPP